MVSKIEVDTVVNQSGDQDSGLDLSTNDVVKVKTANTERMQINANTVSIKAKASSYEGLELITPSGDGSGEFHIGVHDDGGSAGRTLVISRGGSDGMDTESLRINASGEIFIGKTGEVSTQDGFHFKQTGECIIGRGSNDTVFVFQDINSSGATVGSISITSSNTAYNTSSDYRLKENVTTSWDATTRLKQLKPSRFNFKINKDKTVDGFLAHEVSSIVPEAITGEKDAVDKDGNIKPQAIDHSKLVPLLVKTIQELEARIVALESK
tara:strand:+ start:67 stop:867 length:801 start_codon:yes stop_codon:yes gene_type:complete